MTATERRIDTPHGEARLVAANGGSPCSESAWIAWSVTASICRRVTISLVIRFVTAFWTAGSAASGETDSTYRSVSATSLWAHRATTPSGVSTAISATRSVTTTGRHQPVRAVVCWCSCFSRSKAEKLESAKSGRLWRFSSARNVFAFSSPPSPMSRLIGSTMNWSEL